MRRHQRIMPAQMRTHGGNVTCTCKTKREQWTFTGRETHWGYAFLVWTRDDGKRYARVMH